MSRPAWWRRNAVSLLVIAVLLPVTVGVIAVNEWFGFDLGRVPSAVTAQPGDTVRYAGATIGPVRAVVSDDPAAPRGTRVVTASVPMTPEDGPVSCSIPTLREIGGAQRVWTEASSELDREYDPDLHTTCDPELPIRYSLTLEYLVADDASGPFAIEVESSLGASRTARLIIEP